MLANYYFTEFIVYPGNKACGMAYLFIKKPDILCSL